MIQRMECTDVRPVEPVFARLVDRFLDGGVVPFIGAGVSFAATLFSGDGQQIACTEHMIRSLQAALGNCCKEYCGKGAASATEDGTRSLAKLAEEYIWAQRSLGNSCPYTSLVREVLQVHKFAELGPLPAHRYIAFLAREGCIEEIMTSNYDTCLSRAFRDTFYGEWRDSLVEQIADLDSYRAHAGRRHHKANGPMLKIYHINGCAECVQDREDKSRDAGMLEAQCATILLTEAQLQDWRQRHWSREMLKDRLRTRSILFSGFGSPEPQVRHTVMQVIEEFSLPSRPESRQEPDDNGTPWEHCNAPFIHAYEKEPTFEQWQILLEFAAANGNGLPPERLRSQSNHFIGKDIGFFSDGNSRQSDDKTDRLPADVFWQYVYTAVFWRLLERELGQGSTFWYFVDSLVPCANALVKGMRSWLFPNESQSEKRVFGRFPELLMLDDGLTMLSRHIWHMRYRGHGTQEGWYAALSDKCMLIPSYFLILYLLYAAAPDGPNVCLKDIERSIVCEEEIGLGFVLNGGDGAYAAPESGLLMCLAHDESRFADSESIGCPRSAHAINTVIQIIIGHSVKAKHCRLWLVSDGGAKRVHRYVPCYQVPFCDLLRDSQVHSSRYRMLTAKDVAQTFRRNIVARGSLVDSHRDRILAVANLH